MKYTTPDELQKARAEELKRVRMPDSLQAMRKRYRRQDELVARYKAALGHEPTNPMSYMPELYARDE